MKKYFIYELKRNLLTMLVITVFATLIYLSGVLSANFIYEQKGGPDIPNIPPSPNNSLLSVPIIMLMVLCTLVPILMFNFKMSLKQTDCMYSLSIRREKIYLIKSLVGLILVLAPYTIAYWVGFIATVLKPNLFNLVAFVPAYFISLPLAVLLFGINSFIFTRANKPVDGIIFIAMYSCIMPIVVYYIAELAFTIEMWLRDYPSSSFWFTYSPLTWLGTKYDHINLGRDETYKYEWLLYLYTIITGVGAWVGMFLTLNKEKAENAERISDSWFGYKVLVPAYLVLYTAISGTTNISFIYHVILLIAATVGFIIYRRSIKLKLPDIISIGGAWVLGIILALLA